jgi:hypothetical protein
MFIAFQGFTLVNSTSEKHVSGQKKMGLFKIGHPIPSTGSVQHDLFQ